MNKIINNLKTFSSLVPRTKNWRFWIFISFLLKFVFLIFFLFVQEFDNVNYDTIARISNDSVSYIKPFENLAATGNYSPDSRMPGYGWVFYLLRLFFSQSSSLNIIPFIQVLVSSVSVYVLSLTMKKVFESDLMFLLTFIIYLISFNISYYDAYVLTESFSLSSIIFSLYFLLKKERTNWSLFCSGLFLIWACFMKPVLFPLIILYALFVFVWKKKKKLRALCVFLIPVIAIEGAWVLRNYLLHNKLFLATETMYVPEINDTYHKSIWEYSKAIGVSQTGWEPESEFNYFKVNKSGAALNNIKFNKGVFTSKYKFDSLESVRNLILKHEYSNNVFEKSTLDSLISHKMNSYIASVKNEKPFLYYVKSRINILKLFFGHTGVYNLFNRSTSELSFVEMVVKAFYSILYILIVVLGLIGLTTLFFNNYKFLNSKLLLSLAGGYLALIHPLVLKMDEYRYIIPSYPFLIIGMLYLIYKIISKFKDVK